MNMLFTNTRKYGQLNSNNYQYQPVQQMPILSYQPPQIHRPYASNAIDETKTEKPTVKKMKWGEPTWFLFHTLAQKIKDDCFQKIKDELFNNIIVICGNLPCPTCANHALEYMKRVQFSSIRTKNDLKKLFYLFHNEVNTRKGFGVFPYDQLDEKYSKANTLNIIQYFFQFFQDTHSSVHMIANDMHRLRVTKKLKEWFQANIDCFDP